jgi:hypothetical protein
MDDIDIHGCWREQGEAAGTWTEWINIDVMGRFISQHLYYIDIMKSQHLYYIDIAASVLY